jgi:hypothetical protein
MDSIREQLRGNAVAIISLVIAISSLGYNSYRNEMSEENRNIRFAAFTVLRELGELQILVDRSHYGNMPDPTDWYSGFGQAGMVRDLCGVMPGATPGAGTALFEVWQANVGDLFDEDRSRSAAAEAAISRQLVATREAVLSGLKSLE